MLLAPSRASAALPEPRRSHAQSILGLGCAFWGGHHQQAPWGISLPSSRIRGLLVKPCGTRRGARPPENWGFAGKSWPKCQPGSFPCSLTAPQQNLSLRSGYRRARPVPSGSLPPFSWRRILSTPGTTSCCFTPLPKSQTGSEQPKTARGDTGDTGTRTVGCAVAPRCLLVPSVPSGEPARGHLLPIRGRLM